MKGASPAHTNTADPEWTYMNQSLNVENQAIAESGEIFVYQ